MTLRSAVGAAGLPLSSCTEKKATIEVRVLPAGGDGSVKPLRPMPSQLGAAECIAQAARLDAFDPSARPLVTQLHGAPGSGPVGACTPADDAVGALAATLGAKIGGKPLELNLVGGAAVGAPSGLLACEPVRFAAIAAAAPSDPPSLRTGRACAGGSARATLARGAAAADAWVDGLDGAFPAGRSPCVEKVHSADARGAAVLALLDAAAPQRPAFGDVMLGAIMG